MLCRPPPLQPRHHLRRHRRQERRLRTCIKAKRVGLGVAQLRSQHRGLRPTCVPSTLRIPGSRGASPLTRAALAPHRRRLPRPMPRPRAGTADRMSPPWPTGAAGTYVRRGADLCCEKTSQRCFSSSSTFSSPVAYSPMTARRCLANGRLADEEVGRLGRRGELELRHQLVVSDRGSILKTRLDDPLLEQRPQSRRRPGSGRQACRAEGDGASGRRP